MQVHQYLRFLSRLAVVTLLAAGPLMVNAQRSVGGEVVYGNEWIVEGVDYAKVFVTEEGVYRVSLADLGPAGWSGVTGADLKLELYGEEQPLYVSSDGAWGADDFAEFYVDHRLRARYEGELFAGGADDNLNPSYGMFSDSIVYALSQQVGPRMRYEEVAHVASPGGEVATSALARARQPRPIWITKSILDKFGQKFSSFRRGEGWGYEHRRDTRVDFQLPGRVTGGGGAVSLRAATSFNSNQGGAYLERVPELYVGGELLWRDTVRLLDYLKIETAVPAAALDNLSASGLLLRGTTDPFDRYAVGEVKLLYEADLVVSDGQVGRRVGAQTSPAPSHRWLGLDRGREYRVYVPDLQQLQRLPLGTEATSTFPALTAGARLAITSDQGAKSVAVRRWRMGSLPERGTQYLIVDAPPQNSWAVNAEDYAAMRRSTQGGGFDVGIATTTTLRDRFGYGQPFDPRGVRNGIQYLRQRDSLRYVLLLGKGREFMYTRDPVAVSQDRGAEGYVPTYGTPGSDNLLATNAVTGQLDVAVGRLPMESADDLRIVMEKMRAVTAAGNAPQTVDSRAWQKRVLHLAGGSDAREQAELRSRLDRMQSVFERTDFAPNYANFQKRSDIAVQQADNEELFASINEGASIVTVFGHSSPGTFDFNIDNPDQYSNRDRYPLLFGLGCYSGNMHITGKSIGERFVLYEKKGYAGFLGSIGLGYTGDLEQMFSRIYGNLGDEYYGQPFGDALRISINQALQSTSSTQRQLGEQLSLNGDPGMRLYSFPGPDYVTAPESFSTDAATVVESVGEVEVRFTLHNIGRSGSDSVDVFIDRSNDARERVQVDSFRVTGLRDTLRVVRTLASWGDEGGGANQVWVRLRPVRSDEERPVPQAVTNNEAGPFDFLLESSAVDILWPRANAVLRPDSVLFYGSTRNAFGAPVDVRWELATDAGFADIVDQSDAAVAGLFEWSPSTALAPGRTYHYRLTATGTTRPPAVGTFTVEDGVIGTNYALTTPGQIRGGKFEQMEATADGTWDFVGTGFYVTLRNKEFVADDPPAYIVNLGQSATSVRPWRHMPVGIAVAYADDKNISLVRNLDPGSVGSVDTEGSRVFGFETNEPQARRDFIRFIEEVIPDSSYVFIWSVYGIRQDFNFEAYRADSTDGGLRTVFAAIREQGAERVDEWGRGSTTPYTFVYQKGVGTLAEDLGAERDDVVRTDLYFQTAGYEGAYVSPVLPHSLAGGTLEYEVAPGPLDSFSTQLLRIARDTQIVAERLGRAGTYELPDAPDSVGYALRVFQRNWTTYRARAVRRLSYRYTPQPELAFDVSKVASSPNDTLLPGEAFPYAFDLANVSPTPIEDPRLSVSRLVNGNRVPLSAVDVDRMEPWQATRIDQALATDSLRGEVQLVWQAELAGSEFTEINNLSRRSIYVTVDEVAPTLRLLVDGEKPAPGGTLVTDPTFDIVVTEDNGYLNLGTEAISLSLTTPDDGVLGGTALPGTIEKLDERREGAQGQELRFRFDPGPLADGDYALRASVVDAAGNRESEPQVVRFEVSNRSSVSNVLPYPNPAVDNIRFQYEATGEVPSHYAISIYTTGGRLVHTLTEAELGSMTVGRNLTPGAWDGTDQFGQRLARGTYLYRFDARNESRDLEQRETTFDRYVESGFGKLVLLR